MLWDKQILKHKLQYNCLFCNTKSTDRFIWEKKTLFVHNYTTPTRTVNNTNARFECDTGIKSAEINCQLDVGVFFSLVSKKITNRCICASIEFLFHFSQRDLRRFRRKSILDPFFFLDSSHDKKKNIIFVILFLNNFRFAITVSH